MPSSKDIIRNRKTGTTFKIMGDGNGRMSDYWMLRVVKEDGTYDSRTAMLAHAAWSADWEIVK